MQSGKQPTLDEELKKFIADLDKQFPIDALNNLDILLDAFSKRVSLKNPNRLVAGGTSYANLQTKDYNKDILISILKEIEDKGPDSKLFDTRALKSFKEDFIFSDQDINSLNLTLTDRLKIEAILTPLLNEVQLAISYHYMGLDMDTAQAKTQNFMNTFKEGIKESVHKKVKTAKLFQLYSPEFDKLTTSIQSLIDSIEDPEMKRKMMEYKLEVEKSKSNISEMSDDNIKVYLEENSKRIDIFKLYQEKSKTLISHLNDLITIENTHPDQGPSMIKFYQINITGTQQAIRNFLDMSSNQINDEILELDKQIERFEVFKPFYESTFNKLADDISKMNTSNQTYLIKEMDSLKGVLLRGDEGSAEDLNTRATEIEMRLTLIKSKISVYEIYKPKLEKLSAEIQSISSTLLNTEMKKYWDNNLSILETTSNKLLTINNIESIILDIEFPFELLKKFMPEFDKLISKLRTLSNHENTNDLQHILDEVNKIKNTFFKYMDEASVEKFIKMTTDEIELHEKFPEQAHELSKLIVHMTTMIEAISDPQIKQQWLDEIQEIRNKLSTNDPEELNKLLDDKKRSFYQQIPNILNTINNNFYTTLHSLKEELKRKCTTLSLIENTNNTELKSKYGDQIPGHKDRIVAITKEIENLNQKIQYMVEAIQIGITEYNPLVSSLNDMQLPPILSTNVNSENVNVQVANQDYKEKSELARQTFQDKNSIVKEENKNIQNAAETLLHNIESPSTYDTIKANLNRELINIYVSSIEEFIKENKGITQADLDETFGNIFEKIFGIKPQLEGNQYKIDIDIISKLGTYSPSQFVQLINETLSALGEKKSELSSVVQGFAENAVKNLVSLTQTGFNTAIISDTVNKFEKIENNFVKKIKALKENNNSIQLQEPVQGDKNPKPDVSDNKPNFFQQAQELLSKDNKSEDGPGLLDLLGQQMQGILSDEPVQEPQQYQLSVSYKNLTPEFKEANDPSVYIQTIIQSQTKLEKSKNDTSNAISSAKEAQVTLNEISNSSGTLLKAPKVRKKLLAEFVSQIVQTSENKDGYSNEISLNNENLTNQFMDIIKSAIIKNPKKSEKKLQKRISELNQVLNNIKNENLNANKIILLKDLYLELIKNTHFRGVLESELLKEKIEAFIKTTNHFTQVPASVSPMMGKEVEKPKSSTVAITETTPLSDQTLQAKTSNAVTNPVSPVKDTKTKTQEQPVTPNLTTIIPTTINTLREAQKSMPLSSEKIKTREELLEELS